MNQDIKKLWIKALVSGEFQQTTNQLFDGESYCCLGVLCELHRRATNEGDWDDDTTYFSKKDSTGSIDTLPKFVQEWAGLTETDPTVSQGADTLAGLNDSGANFGEIAEIIKDEL